MDFYLQCNFQKAYLFDQRTSLISLREMLEFECSLWQKEVQTKLAKNFLTQQAPLSSPCLFEKSLPVAVTEKKHGIQCRSCSIGKLILWMYCLKKEEAYESPWPAQYSRPLWTTEQASQAFSSACQESSRLRGIMLALVADVCCNSIVLDWWWNKTRHSESCPRREEGTADLHSASQS